MSAGESALFTLWFMTLPLGALLALALAGRRSPGLLAVGALVLVAGLAGDARELRRQLELRSWRPVTGHVVVSERGPGRNDWTFAYAYEAAGEPRQGSVYTHRPRLRSRADTDRLYAAHPVGRQIEVFVDPDDPDRAVVDATPGYGVAVGGLLVHAGLLLAWLRAWRSRPRPD